MAAARRVTPVLFYVVFTALLMAIYNLVDSAVTQAVVYSSLGAIAATAVFVGRVARRQDRVKSWLAIALSMACWSAGDITWYSIDVEGYVPYPSIAEPLYLLGYVLLAAGLAGIAFSGRRRIAVVSDLIDVSIISLCVALAAWPFVFEPALENGWSGAAAVTVGYAGGDIVLLGLLAALVFNPSKRTPAIVLLGCSVLSVFAADIVFYVPQAFISSTSADFWSTEMWMVGYIVVGMAGLLHRQPASFDRRHRSSIGRLGFVGGALLALPSALALDVLAGDGYDEGEWKIFSAAFVIAIVLIIARSQLLLRQIDRSRAENERMRVRMQTVFDSAGVGMIIRDGDYLSETNSAFQEMLGYSAAELAGMRYLDVVHPEELSDTRAYMSIPPGAKVEVERRYIHRNGSTVLGRVTFTEPDESLQIAVVEDITMKAMAERQQQESQRLEAVGRLAGGIAHDFNNLLTAVIGHAQLIQQTDDPAENADSADVIVQAGERAASLTRQLLAFSRLQQLAESRIDTAELMRRNADLLNRLLGGTVRVDVQVSGEAPPVIADPSQIDQVLMNLAVNARDAMPEGGTLSLSVGPYRRTTDDPSNGVPAGDYCRFTVSDTGHGMDEATANRIFDPYFTTKEVGKGTGLGLATTHGIITQAGGHIRVSSQPGAGTTFEVLLPAAPAAEPNTLSGPVS